MSGSEELAQAEGEEMEGGEEVEGNEDDQELAAMQKELEKVEQQKAELDKLSKGAGAADTKPSSCPMTPPPCLQASTRAREHANIPARSCLPRACIRRDRSGTPRGPRAAERPACVSW